LVRDQDAVFFTELDAVTVFDPRKTRLVADDTPSFRRSRLWLESLLRQSPTPASDTRVVAGHRGLLDHHFCLPRAGIRPGLPPGSPTSPRGPARLLDIEEGRSGTVLAEWLAAHQPGWRARIGTASLEPVRGYATALATQ
jgi:hypothetical protein